MSLEATQSLDNQNQVLIKGAELAAAGKALGLSEEETLAAVSRQYRRQKRADQSLTKSDVVRQMMQSASSIQTEVGTPELQGVGYKGEDDVAFAFGEDVGYNSETGRTRADDEQTYRDNDRGFTTDEETGLVRRENFEETRGNSDPVAPKSALRDALGDLERAKGRDSGMMGAIGRFFGGGNPVDTEIDTAQAALQQHLQSDRPSDARVGRAMVRQDRQRFDDEVMEANDFRADAEAQAIARDGYTFNGPGAMADEAIGKIAEIRSLGKIGETAHVIRTADDAIQGQITRRHDGVYLDPRTGNPVAIQGPELPTVMAGDRTPNNGSSSNSLNAPQTAREWVASTVPEYREGGRTFGDYPQVDITMETTNFANQLREYGRKIGMNSLENVSSNIRSVEELQKVASAVDQFTRQDQDSKKKLLIQDPNRPGRNIPAGGQIVSGLMNALRMSSGDEQRLANALFQLDAAERSSVNQNPTGTYLGRSVRGPGPEKGVVFDAPEAMGGFGGTPIATQKKGSSIRVGTDEKGKPVRRDIVAQLATLDSPDAAKPYIGMPRERPSSNSTSTLQQDQVFNKSGETSQSGIRDAITAQARKRAKGGPIDEARNEQNVIGAQAVQRRADEDRTRRADQMSEIIESLPPVARRSRLGRA